MWFLTLSALSRREYLSVGAGVGIAGVTHPENDNRMKARQGAEIARYDRRRQTFQALWTIPAVEWNWYANQLL